MVKSTDEKTYGRKVVRGTVKKKDVFMKRLFITMGICFLVGAIIGSIITGIIVHKQTVKKMQQETVSEAEIEVIEQQEAFGAGDNRVFTEEMSLDWSDGEDLGFVALDNIDLSEDLQEFTYCLAYAYNIDYSLVLAMMEHESSFRTNIISDTNDYGLMQINIVNHEWLTETLGVTDFLDAKQNIRSGLFVLRKLFEKYGNNVQTVLMAYNMGEDGADRCIAQGITSTEYSEEITERQVEFQKMIEERKEGNDN